MGTALSTAYGRGAALVSIVIPVFNEGNTLKATLASIQSETVPLEIIVVDSGSPDDSAVVATTAGARVVRSHFRQRAHQLNLGAQQSRAETTLFLTSATIIPYTAIDLIV
jgi:glycosyltransferase involved in cell wall biosynthesis